MTVHGRSGAELRLLAHAFALTLVVRAALAVLPFRLLRRALRSAPRTAVRAAPSVARIAWAVDASGRRVPGARCLTRALVAERLLHRAGHAARLRVGVAAPGAEGSLDAHAWVEVAGEVVVGGGALERFTPLPLPAHWGR